MTFKDEFWMQEGGLQVFDEHGFFDNSSRMEDECGQHRWLGINEEELVPCKEKLIDVPVSVSESGIDLSEVVPLENSNGFLSAPTAPNQDMSLTFGEGIDHTASTVQSHDKDGCNGVSWGSYQEVMDALSLPISSYSLLYEMPRKKEVFEPNTKAMVIKTCAVKSSPKSTSKNTVVKKSGAREPLETFPSNVKSLTGTGMFDGVLVQYVSPTSKLPGIISGPGYLCGCQSCKFSRAVNAYEFEHHAGCKTSHPNNHIRFENGKSMRQIVQDLKATPRTMLFDTIQTVAGFPINQKAFNAWKESFESDYRSNQYLEMGNGGTIQM